jgi:uncharacterized secreted protein with C-terminal beta-propeller domain
MFVLKIKLKKNKKINILIKNLRSNAKKYKSAAECSALLLKNKYLMPYNYNKKIITCAYVRF